MLCFKFNQNCTINEEFDFWGWVKALLRGGTETIFQKFDEVQNGSPNPHRKFQYSSSIRKCLKIGGTKNRNVGVTPILYTSKGEVSSRSHPVL